jgi:hypothetical protein
MTYACAWALQRAIYAALTADAAIASEVEGRIWDEPPNGADIADPAGPYLLIGEDRAEPWSTVSDRGAAHALTLTVVAPAGGFAAAKRVAGAVCDVMLDLPPLVRGRVVNASFLGGRARRDSGGGRRVDLRFRVVVEDASV